MFCLPKTAWPPTSNVVTNFNSPTGPVASTITLPGLLSGQYLFPQFGFQFADAPPGFPNVPNNFQAMNFLTAGEGGNPSNGPKSDRSHVVL